MTIDDIFAALPEEPAQDAHEFLVIDPATRTIQVPDSESIFGVEGDEDGERKYFICPRYVGDHIDLAACFLSIVYRNANGETDQYLVNDAAVNGEYVTFSWLISEKVVKYKGAVQFRFDADTAAGPAWGTTMAQGESLEGMEPEIDTGTVEEQTSDVVTQLRAMVTQQTGNVEAVGAAQVQNVKTEGAAQVNTVKATGDATEAAALAAIEAKGQATLATIPEDYTALQAQADKLTRDRAAAIVCQAEGDLLQITDASNDPLQGLRIFGKSTQDGTPTPDAPVEIVSLAAPVVTVAGKNLLVQTCSDKTISGVTFTVNPDGSITANGTSTGVFTYAINGKLTGLQKGKKYTLTGNPSNSADYMLYFDQKDASGNNLGSCQDYGQGKTMEIAENYSHLWVGIFAQTGVTFNNLTFYPMLRLAEIDDDTYEPYTGQTLPITTPGSLPGIPVTSGGNYTDANGQQWIADEVDLARGVYVQRVKKFVLADLKTETWYTWGVDHSTAGFTGFYHYFNDDVTNDMVTSNIGVYSKTAWGGVGAGVSASADGNYFMVSVANADLSDVTTDEKATESFISLLEETSAYIMAAIAPIETALSDVELQAYLALHSNKPTTTVLNDAGAHMVLEYAADPKTYIDNKLAALVTANN